MAGERGCVLGYGIEEVGAAGGGEDGVAGAVFGVALVFVVGVVAEAVEDEDAACVREGGGVG